MDNSDAVPVYSGKSADNKCCASSLIDLFNFLHIGLEIDTKDVIINLCDFEPAKCTSMYCYKQSAVIKQLSGNCTVLY